MKTSGLLAFLLAVLMISGCGASPPGEFAIYLLKNQVTAELPLSSSAAAEIEEQPFIAAKDLISYSRDAHQIELTTEAFEKIRTLPVPVRGRPFAVCLGKEVIYTGAFWTPISSIGFNGIVIMKPLSSEDKIKLEPGYPTDSFFQGKDPRNNLRIFDALERAGKLK